MEYEILYVDRNIRQRKHLISHSDYLDVVKPNREIVYRYDAEKNLDKSKRTVSEEVYLEAKHVLKGFPQNFFTDQSPLYKAIQTGVLECNGRYDVVISLVHHKKNLQ